MYIGFTRATFVSVSLSGERIQKSGETLARTERGRGNETEEGGTRTERETEIRKGTRIETRRERRTGRSEDEEVILGIRTGPLVSLMLYFFSILRIGLLWHTFIFYSMYRSAEACFYFLFYV